MNAFLKSMAISAILTAISFSIIKLMIWLVEQGSVWYFGFWGVFLFGVIFTCMYSAER